MVPTVVGALFACTVTAMVCVAVAAPSLAVTVTVALPTVLGVIVTVESDTLTAALLAAEEVAV